MFCVWTAILIQNSPVLKLYTWVVKYAHFVDCQDYLNTSISLTLKVLRITLILDCGAQSIYLK